VSAPTFPPPGGVPDPLQAIKPEQRTLFIQVVALIEEAEAQEKRAWELVESRRVLWNQIRSVARRRRQIRIEVREALDALGVD